MRREPVAPGEVRGWILTVQDDVASTTGRAEAAPPWLCPGGCPLGAWLMTPEQV